MAEEQYTPLDGLDAVPWKRLKTAHVPKRLRALATNWRMREQLEGIEQALVHYRRGLSPAAAATVPFLVELARTPKIRNRADIVDLLGHLAWVTNELGPNPQTLACREALIAAHDQLVPLLKDRSAKVRKQAVLLLWRCTMWSPRAAEIEAALVARDAKERDLAVRITSRLEGGKAGRAAVLELAAVPDEQLRLANVLARRALRRESVTALELVDVALAPTVPRDVYGVWRNEGRWLADSLCAPGDEDVQARTEIIAALLDRGSGAVRAGALTAAAAVMAKSRAATKSLLPRLGDALSDDSAEVRMMAADLLAAAGEAGMPYSHRLAGLLGDEKRTVAEAAAWALARQGDERAVPTVLRLIRDYDDKFGTHHLSEFAPDFDEMVTTCARRYPDRVVPALHAALERCGPEPTPHQRTLWNAVAACGPAGFGAEDALLLILGSGQPQLALTVLAGAGAAAAHLGPWIEALVRIVKDPLVALRAARVHRLVTGDQTVLLDVLESFGTPRLGCFAHEFALAGPLLDPADRSPVLAGAEKWLRENRSGWDMTGAPDIAVAVWRNTDSAGLAVAVLKRALESPSYEQVRLEALRAIAEMGPAARPLRPQVLALLSRDARVAKPGRPGSIALDDAVRTAALDALASTGP